MGPIAIASGVNRRRRLPPVDEMSLPEDVPEARGEFDGEIPF